MMARITDQVFRHTRTQTGMHYLHREAPVKVIHRDLKSQNGTFGCDVWCYLCSPQYEPPL